MTNEVITSIVQQTAASIGASFRCYWPADEHDRNDAAEANLTIHFAHVLLNQGFSVFAEANHPESPKVQGIDLVGFAPNHDWFLACEFKRLWTIRSIYGKGKLFDDVNRLAGFWLNRNLKETSCGELIVANARNCAIGFGLVAGLCWKNRLPMKIWRDSNHPAGQRLRARIAELDGTLLEPLPSADFSDGQYHLLAACFPIKLPAQ